MFSAEQLAELLDDRSITVISERTGLSYTTLWRLKQYPEFGVDYSTVESLSRYFEGRQ